MFAGFGVKIVAQTVYCNSVRRPSQVLMVAMAVYGPQPFCYAEQRLMPQIKGSCHPAYNLLVGHAKRWPEALLKLSRAHIIIGLSLSASIGGNVSCLHFCLAGVCSELCSLYLVLIRCHLFLVSCFQPTSRVVGFANIMMMWLLCTNCTCYFG